MKRTRLEAGTAILVVLTSATHCKLDNISYAVPITSKIETVAECKALAKTITSTRGSTGAFCLDPATFKPIESGD